MPEIWNNVKKQNAGQAVGWAQSESVSGRGNEQYAEDTGCSNSGDRRSQPGAGSADRLGDPLGIPETYFG